MDKFVEYIQRGDKLNTLKEGLIILNDKFIPFVFFILSELFIFNDQLINKLLTIDLEGDNQVYIYFGIAKNYELKEDYKNAFKYFQIANQLKYDMINNTYDFANEYSTFNILKDMNIPNIDDISDKKIIFIVGMPRCGSTLLSKIINYNNKFKDSGENYDLNIIVEIVKRNLLDYKDKVKNFVDGKYNENIIDKTLSNFQLIGIIKQVFTNAKIIHLKRDKGEQLWSNYTNLYALGLQYTYNWETLNKYYDYYIEYMDHWNNKYDDILNIQFEELKSDSNTVLKKIFDYIEEDFSEECYNFYKKDEKNKTASNFQVKEPLNNRKYNKFEHYKEFIYKDKEVKN